MKKKYVEDPDELGEDDKIISEITKKYVSDLANLE